MTLLQRRRHFSNCAAVLSAVAAQFSVILMASSLQDKAVWNNDEAMALINYLCEHKAEGGGNGGFKDVSFNGAAECIATHWTSGPVKTAKHCKTKWTSVCIFLLIVY